MYFVASWSCVISAQLLHPGTFFMFDVLFSARQRHQILGRSLARNSACAAARFRFHVCSSSGRYR